ncbi:hypothetical protein GCM10009712_42650 [Pseudarthrobacter sulfonivorans]
MVVADECGIHEVVDPVNLPWITTQEDAGEFGNAGPGPERAAATKVDPKGMLSPTPVSRRRR